MVRKSWLSESSLRRELRPNGVKLELCRMEIIWAKANVFVKQMPISFLLEMDFGTVDDGCPNMGMISLGSCKMDEDPSTYMSLLSIAQFMRKRIQII